MEPVYVTRRQNILWGIGNIILGVIVYTKVPILGQLFVAIGFGMIFQGIIHKRKRIA